MQIVRVLAATLVLTSGSAHATTRDKPPEITLPADTKNERLRAQAALCEAKNGLALLMVDPEKGVIVVCVAPGWTFPKIRE